MSLSSGTRLGPYEIGAPLGSGGMGEVYRARDTRLGRDVAVKVMPETLAADPSALARFEAEARAVAALSHPHIMSIHDFGREDATTFAVMELLEGATLRQRLGEGPLPARKAVELARDVAQGLAAAHEKGIVHRDLKPENLFVTKGGRVKILDFGLARQTSIAAQSSDTKSPTLAQTAPGTVLGTVGYMSPEQVKGLPADARSDIFSFGAVLYEMLTGRRAFERASAVETMAAILREEPPEPSSSGAHVPPGLDRIVRHCLEKDPEERFRSAHDLAFALDAAAGASGASAAVVAEPAKQRVRAFRWPVLAATAVVCLAAGAALHRAFAPVPAPPLVSVRPLTHSGADLEPAVSPDGRTIAFTSSRDGTSRIWLKQLVTGEEVAVSAGPDRAPRFSPDGTQLLFLRNLGLNRVLQFSETATDLYRMPVVGGAPRRLAILAGDADWSPDGASIAFLRMRIESGKRISSLHLVKTEGGEPKELARWPDRYVAIPRFSPDGRTVVMMSAPVSGSSAAAIRYELVPMDGSGARALDAPPTFGTSSGAAWSASGNSLTYIQALLATYGSSRVIRQDVKTGKSVPLLLVPFESAVVDPLPDGRFVVDSRSSRQNLVEYALDQPGSSPRWLTRGSSVDRQPVYSRDGARLAFSSDRSGNLDIWEIELKTGALRRLTEHETDDWDPGFTPDGHMLWSSGRTGHLEIWTAEADGGSPRRVSDDGTDAENPTTTPDGWVIYTSTAPKKAGLWKVHLDGTRAARLCDCLALPDTSPDGKYVGCSDPSVGPIRFFRVSDGARLPLTIDVAPPRPTEVQMGRVRWSPDGKRVYFVAQDENGVVGIFEQAFDPEKADTRATRRKAAGFDPAFEAESFGVSPDGKHLVVAALERTYGIAVIEGIGDGSRSAKPR